MLLRAAKAKVARVGAGEQGLAPPQNRADLGIQQQLGSLVRGGTFCSKSSNDLLTLGLDSTQTQPEPVVADDLGKLSPDSRQQKGGQQVIKKF